MDVVDSWEDIETETSSSSSTATSTSTSVLDAGVDVGDSVVEVGRYNPSKYAPFLPNLCLGRDVTLRWTHSIEDNLFYAILKKMTTPQSFNLNTLWTDHKSQIVPVAGKKYAKQKTQNVAKKADLIKAQNNQRLVDQDTKFDEHCLQNSQSLLNSHQTCTFAKYKQMITQLRTPAKQVEMKVILFAHFLRSSDWENLIDMYLTFRSIRPPQVTTLLMDTGKLLESKSMDLIEYQMTQLSHRLPPLLNFATHPVTLDPWQMDVLSLIDQKQSVLVCAPTSAGKTLISTYAATSGHKVIFIAPSEPLANQVAGLFRDLLGGQVEIMTKNYHVTSPQTLVVVGTPEAVEAGIIDGHFVPEYAIFDEIHELNGAEGRAYERLLKILDCPCLGLSATIANPESLRDWFQGLHHRPIHLVNHQRRFVNLQRHYWDNNQVRTLHPMSLLTLTDLLDPLWSQRELNLTPRDVYQLWQLIEQVYGQSEDLSAIAPTRIFSHHQWISLDECHRYEKVLLQFLAETALTDPERVTAVLRGLRVQINPRSTTEQELYQLSMELKNSKMTPAIMFQMSSTNAEDMYQKLIAEAESQEEFYLPYYRELLTLQHKHYTDHVEQVESFDKDKSKDKSKEADKSGLSKQDQIKQAVSKLEQVNVGKSIVEVNEFLGKWSSKITYMDLDPQVRVAMLRYVEDFRLKNEARLNLYPVEVWQPHEDFCFSTECLSDQGLTNIKWAIETELRDASHPELKSKLRWEGWFLRGISRGLGLYIDHITPVYQRAVQWLAQDRKLAVIISDQSLAYGVNLPIRTCCLVGYDQVLEFPRLVSQQMTGRAGRRGYDQAGHIIYVNTPLDQLMNGQLSTITGLNYESPVVSTYHQISPMMTLDRMDKLLSTSLGEFLERSHGHISVNRAHYERSQTCLREVGADQDLILKHVLWVLRDTNLAGLTWVKYLPVIEQSLTTSLDKQVGKANHLWRIVVKIFQTQTFTLRDSPVPNLAQLAQMDDDPPDVVTALVEFRMVETYAMARRHQLKHDLINLGTMVMNVSNLLFHHPKYPQTYTYLVLLFEKIKDLLKDRSSISVVKNNKVHINRLDY